MQAAEKRIQPSNMANLNSKCNKKAVRTKNYIQAHINMDSCIYIHIYMHIFIHNIYIYIFSIYIYNHFSPWMFPLKPIATSIYRFCLVFSMNFPIKVVSTAIRKAFGLDASRHHRPRKHMFHQLDYHVSMFHLILISWWLVPDEILSCFLVAYISFSLTFHLIQNMAAYPDLICFKYHRTRNQSDDWHLGFDQSRWSRSAALGF